MSVLHCNAMPLLDAGEVFAKRRHQPLGKHRYAVLGPFTVPHDDLTVFELDVLDAQSQGLEQPSPAPYSKLAMSQ